MKKTMQIFAAVGPLGAGKTTFVLNVIQALESKGFPTREKAAYVVNDEGALIDGELARQRAEVVAMTNGCFTCGDTAELRAILERLEQSGITWVFLEGFGLIPGNETRGFLESCRYPFHILCLLSLKHHAFDLIRYAHVIRSQVKAATVAVGVTKYQHQGNHLLDLDTADGLPEFVAKENPGVPIVLIPDSADLPDIVLNPFEGKAKRKIGLSVSRVHHHGHEHHAGCGCGSHHHHQHDHSHDRHHVHDMHPYSFELRDGVSLDDIKQVFMGRDFLLRVKGAVEGHLFNEVHRDWRVSIEDKRQFVTFYASRKVEIESELPELQALILLKKEEGDVEPGYKQLRHDVADRESTVAEIQKLLAEMPTDPVIIPSGAHIRLLTHPETLQTLKDGIARRPSVKDEWFPKVLKRCTEYWVKCAAVINSRSSDILPGDIGKNRRELGVSMTWWVNRHGDSFGPELVGEVERLHPGAMVAEGMLFMTSLNSDPEKASWECPELSEALSYGIAHGDDPEKMIEAARHCLSLAKTPEMKSAWSQSLDRLEEEGKILV
jgi:G3E family GTPase